MASGFACHPAFHPCLTRKRKFSTKFTNDIEVENSTKDFSSFDIINEKSPMNRTTAKKTVSTKAPEDEEDSLAEIENKFNTDEGATSLRKDPDKRITLEENKKHNYFKDISFLKVYKKQYGNIKIKKREKNAKKSPVLIGEQYFEKNEEEKLFEEKLKKVRENDDYIQFKQDQLKLDEDKNFTFLDGKISFKEMKNDQKRDMKNYVREFYFVKKEDEKQMIDFHLTVNDKPLNEENK